MDFTDHYFSLCDFKPIKDSSISTPFYFCKFNTYILFLFFLILLWRLFVHFIRFLQRQPTLSLKKLFHQSIFTYTHKEHPYTSYFLYFLMSQGIYFTRPLGFLFIYIVLNNLSSFNPFFTVIAFTLVTSITSTLYFFSMIFMINFYGIKAEIMRDKGDPSISVDEREHFLNMVIQRSKTFSYLFFGGSLLNIVFGRAVFGNDAFAMPGTSNDNLKYEWALRIISYGFITILLINRLNYMRYTRKMAEGSTLLKKNVNNLISISRLMEEHSFLPETLPELIDDISAENEEFFLLDFQSMLLKKKRQASFILNETRKILHTGNVAYQPILRNPMENYLGGTLWIVVTLFDSIFNLVASPLFFIYPRRNETILIVLSYIMFIFYIIETTLQAYLTNKIVSKKENFGDHLDIQGRGSEINDVVLEKDDLVDSGELENDRLSAIETMTPQRGHVSKSEL